MKKTMRYFLSITNIDKIGLCAAGLKMRLYHLVHYIGPEYVNVQKSVLYVEKSVIGQVISLSKKKMMRKKNLLTATPNIKYDQVMSKTFNAGLCGMKM